MSQIHMALERARRDSRRPTLDEKSPWSESFESPADPGKEPYHRIAQTLLSLPQEDQPRLLLVVSAVAGEGTSTVARELAVSLGQGGVSHVLLVDANLRSPSQHEAFDLARAKGLTELTSNRLQLDQAFRPGVRPGLSVLTAGRPTNNPGRHLAQSSFHNLLRRLDERFDWIVIDGAPVTMYSDAVGLAGSVSGAILVIQAEQTRREVAQQAQRILREAGTSVLGAVLNRRQFHIPESIYRRI